MFLYLLVKNGSKFILYQVQIFFFLISFLDHLCLASGILSKTSQRSSHVLKVTCNDMGMSTICNNISSSLTICPSNYGSYTTKPMVLWTFYLSLADMSWHFIILWIFQVPQQLRGSNNCGFHMFMFIDHFLKVNVDIMVITCT